MDYLIREIEPRDNREIEQVIRSCLMEFGGDRDGTAWCDPDLCRFSEIYAESGRKYWVVLDETNTIVGGAGIGPLTGVQGVCELQKMYCLPAARGTGAAHQLMKLCLDYAKQFYHTCYLETFSNMYGAQKFYAKHGFCRLDVPMGGTGHYSCDVWYAKNLKADITVKKAQPQDLAAIAELYGAVCDYLQDKPFNPNWRRDIFPTREDAETYLAADGLYAAWDGETVVGSIALTAKPEAADILCIQEVAVHPDHLRRGISAAMLAFAEKEAVARNAKAVQLYVWEHNEPAIRAYEKSGFTRLGKEDIGLGEFGLDWFYRYEKRL